MTNDQQVVCARLDKTGRFVLCARVDCGTRLGHILEIDLGELCRGVEIDVEMSDGYRRPVNDGDRFRSVILAAGWRPSPSGVWQLSRHAQEAVRHGRPSKHRRPYAQIPGGMRRQHNDAPAIPAQIECPTCHLQQMLDQQRLRLTDRPFALIPSDSITGWFTAENAGT